MRAPGVVEIGVNQQSHPHTPEDFEHAVGPGFLTSGDLLAAPSHPLGQWHLAAFVPVTVAGAVSAFHRLPFETSSAQAYRLKRL